MSDYNQFIEDVITQLTPYKKYQLQVEIDIGDTISSGEIVNCDRTYQIWDDKRIISEFTIEGCSYETPTELNEDRNSSPISFLEKLANTVAEKIPLYQLVSEGNYFSLKESYLIEDKDTFEQDRVNSARDQYGSDLKDLDDEQVLAWLNEQENN